MGSPTPLIRAVSTPALGRVAIVASDGRRYHADLSMFEAVYCFPKDFETWSAVWIDSHELALVWPTRFEVHVDQVIGLASHVEPVNDAA